MKIILNASIDLDGGGDMVAVADLNPTLIAAALKDVATVANLKAQDDQTYCLEKWSEVPVIYEITGEIVDFLGDDNWRPVSDVKLKKLLGKAKTMSVEAVRRAAFEDSMQWRGYLKHDNCGEWSTGRLTKADLLALLEKVAA